MAAGAATLAKFHRLTAAGGGRLIDGMKADIFTTCESATDNEDGTFTIYKAFSSFLVPSFPCNAEDMVFYTRLHCEEDESGERAFTLLVIDADGSVLGRGQRTILIPKAALPQNRVHSIVLNMPILVLKQSGEYAVDLLVDDNFVLRSSFYVDCLESHKV